MLVSFQIRFLVCHLNLENVNHAVLENLENVKVFNFFVVTSNYVEKAKGMYSHAFSLWFA